jgi:uncharacterized protein involved in type VI secretion and phage assembly
MPANTNTDDLLARLIERVEGRYYGKYRGIVTDNNDPDNLGRIKAQVPQVLGTEETGWALPAFAYGGAAEQGIFAVPDQNAGVWIEFEAGNLSYPIWSGTWYTSSSIPESASPAQKIWKTKSGHKIVLDDDGGTLGAWSRCRSARPRRSSSRRRKSSWSRTRSTRWSSATTCSST